jgi:hypothetical protein
MGTFIAVGEKETSLMRLKVLHMGLRSEALGMKLTRGRSALAICKSEFGWKGNRLTILRLLEAEILKRQQAALESKSIFHAAEEIVGKLNE